MIWFLFAFLTALSQSMLDVFSKKSLKEIDEYIVSWSLAFFALPFLFISSLFVEIPSLGDSFWWALIIGGRQEPLVIDQWHDSLGCIG